MIMKNNSLIAITLALLATLVVTEAPAQDCGSNYSDCCSTDFCGGQFVVGAEWLYWKAEEDNASLGATITGNSDSSSPDFRSTATEFIEPDFKFTNGYRVSAGYAMPCNGWELDVIYTYLPTHAKSSLFTASGNPSSGPGIFSLVGPFVEVIGDPFLLIYGQIARSIQADQPLPFQTFQQSWDLTFNQVDIDVSRTIAFNNCISLQPHVGFRALWYTDKQKVEATGAFGGGRKLGSSTSETADEDPPAAAPGGTTTFTTDILFKDKFTGYGIEAGLWGKWQIWDGLSVIGHFGGSILYAKFVVNETATTALRHSGTNPNLPPIIHTDTVCDTIHTATPTADYFLGLEYADSMCDVTFAVRVGWEQHVYFDPNRIFQYGDLSTQGLTLGLAVGF